MDQLADVFLSFIADWGYFAVIVLMAAENACIPIPSELILGFAGYLVFTGHMTFWGATTAGMIGGIVGSIFAYEVGAWGGRPFVDKYGKYFLIKSSHVDFAQRWFDKYGLSAVFFSRLLPAIRTFISLPAGFARVDKTKFLILTIAGSFPWTIMLIYAGLYLGENWTYLMEIGHEASLAFVAVCIIVCGYFYYRYRKNKQRQENA